MKNTWSVSQSFVFHTAYIRILLLLALLLLGLFSTPSKARAQNDAIRVMAGRVLDAAAGGASRVDRGGSIWRDDDISRRDRDAWERERVARERYCRKHHNDRRCDSGWLLNQRNDSNWCWDRDRNGRCDSSQNQRRGRGRGPWWDADDRWVPPGRRGR